MQRQWTLLISFVFEKYYWWTINAISQFYFLKFTILVGGLVPFYLKVCSTNLISGHQKIKEPQNWKMFSSIAIKLYDHRNLNFLKVFEYILFLITIYTRCLMYFNSTTSYVSSFHFQLPSCNNVWKIHWLKYPSGIL